MTTTINHDASSRSIYSLRNKFVKKLIQSGFAENALDGAIAIANKMDESSMFETLWSMSFSTSIEQALNQLHVTTLKDLKTPNMFLIPKTLVFSFRNELRYQYTLVHKDFLSVPNDKHAEYFNQLIQGMGMDKVLSTGIYIRVYNFLKRALYADSNLVNKTIFLLNSDKENFRHGGLRNIGLTLDEANELLDRAETIALLLKNLEDAMFTHPQTSLIYPIKESIPNERWQRPFEGLSQRLQEKGLVFSSECTISESSKTGEDAVVSSVEDFESTDSNSQSDSKVTSHAILQNTDLFKQFVRVYDEVCQAGFDVKEVIEKLDAIRNLLLSYDVLS